jgi:hypothetical protein
VSRPALEVADIFRDHGAAWRTANAGHVGLNQLKVMAAIENCRTAALGGHVLRCEKCSHTLIAYNSCRNRHCPKCQGAAANEWLAEREAELLPAPYFHVVFSLPRQIADIAYQNKATIYDLLFKASSETMLTIAADPKHLGARIRNDFGDPQPRRIGDAQRRLVFETGSRLQHPSYFVRAQCDRYLAGFVYEGRLPGQVGSIERHIEEEPQRRDSRIDLGRAGAPR